MGNVIKAYTFGESSKKLKNFLSKNSIDTKQFKTLKAATYSAITDGIKIHKKINILLSPACSSFDQFDNFMQRGNTFKKIVSSRIK